MRVTPFLGFAAVLLLAACPDREVSELTPDQGKVEYKDIPVTVNRDLDLLFVIDNSGSMGEEQASLRANFPEVHRGARDHSRWPAEHPHRRRHLGTWARWAARRSPALAAAPATAPTA